VADGVGEIVGVMLASAVGVDVPDGTGEGRRFWFAIAVEEASIVSVAMLGAQEERSIS